MIKEKDKPTGYPSVDKPWLKYYSEEAINDRLPECTMYEYVYNMNRNRTNAIALNYYGNKISYGQLFHHIKKTANAFANQGIKKGDVVTIMSLETPETIYCIYALNFLGAVANMVYISLPEKEIITDLQNTESKLLIYLDVIAKKIETIEDQIPVNTIIKLDTSMSMPQPLKIAYRLKNRQVNKSNTKSISYDNFTRPLKIIDVQQVKYEKNMPAFIVHTSGTTGEPKSVVHGNDGVNALVFQYKKSGMQFDENDSFLTWVPPFLSIGLCIDLHMPLCLGMCEILCVNPDIDEVTRIFVKNKPNHFLGAPQNLLNIIQNTRNMGYCVTFAAGGETATTDQEELIKTQLSKKGAIAKFITGYGMSEVCATVTTGMNHVNKLGTIGIPLCKTIAKVVKQDTMTELTYNEVGEMCFHTPNLMLGYLKNKVATDEIIKKHQDGLLWLHTGDLGFIDEEGFLHFKGRIKRIYLVKGPDGGMYKVFPTGVEELLMKHPLIHQSAVIVIEDPTNINMQIAFITLKANTTTNQELLKSIDIFCKDNLPIHSIPLEYIILKKMPLKVNGKIDYQTLEKEYKSKLLK